MTDEAKKLVEDNHNLIYWLLRNYNLPIDEYYDLASIGLCKAAMTYNEDLSQFATYAHRVMLSSIFCETRKRKNKKTIPENLIVYYQAEMDDEKGHTTSFVNFIPTDENTEDEVLLKIAFEKYINLLSDRDKVILKLFYEGYKQHDIVKVTGCSQSGIARIKKKLINKLIKMIGSDD